jgi:membrane protease YdiL (CAAX protease family)
VGILFPLVFIQRSGKEWTEFGFSFRKWPIFLSINLVLGILLFFMFLSENPPPAEFRLSAPTLWSAAYVMLALCFELVFFYAFLRTLLERAFGIVPAIILTALFYAFHHVGFQPEYGKLIFVGLLYAVIYRLGNSALLIFPFFLGAGGTYDVLIQSQKVLPILHPQIRTLYLSVLILAGVAYVWWKAGRQKKPCDQG